MTALSERLFDVYVEAPVAAANPATMAIEMAISHAKSMLNRMPMSTESVIKHLNEIISELESHRSDLDYESLTRSMERAESPSVTTVARASRTAPEVETLASKKAEEQKQQTSIRFSGPINQGEADVIYRIASGMSREEVAKDLYLSTDAIKSRLTTMSKKLGLPRAIQAHMVIECLRNGYIDLPGTLNKYGAHCPVSQDQMIVLRYIAFGYRAKEIGEELGISEGLVKSRIEWAAKNLHIPCNQPLLVATAFANGWLD